MLEIVKNALRITSSAYDVEIQGLINACLLDLVSAGVILPIGLSGDNLQQLKSAATLERAIVLYCKANFGFIDNVERFQQAYSSQKNVLRTSGAVL